MTTWRVRLLAAVAGVGLALGAAPFSLPWPVFLAVPLLAFLMSRAQGWKAGLGIGWWAGTAYFAASMYWIVEPFLVEPERHGWMAPFALVLVALGLGVFWAGAFALAMRFSAIGRGIAMVVFWSAAEWARAHVLTGFPWGMIAYGWSETPVFQSLAFVGPHGLTLLTLLCALLPAILPRRIGLPLTAGLVALAWAGLSTRPTDMPATRTTIRLVQPNAPQHLKWRPDMVSIFFDRALAYSEAGDPPDVVIWPETSLPFLWDEAPALRARVVAAGRGAEMILGHRRFLEDGARNSLLHIDGAGGTLGEYDKHHLVPFGEYIPFGDLAARFGIQGLAANDGIGFVPGPGPALIDSARLPPYLPLICYEAIFPGLATLSGDRPAWLVHITNDAWFGSFAGPFQHLVQARARAIEQGLPLARAANTGISALIDPYGRIVASAPLGIEGYVDAALPAALPATPYARLGDWPWAIFMAVALGVILIGHRRKGPETH